MVYFSFYWPGKTNSFVLAVEIYWWHHIKITLRKISEFSFCQHHIKLTSFAIYKIITTLENCQLSPKFEWRITCLSSSSELLVSLNFSFNSRQLLFFVSLLSHYKPKIQLLNQVDFDFRLHLPLIFLFQLKHLIDLDWLLKSVT